MKGIEEGYDPHMLDISTITKQSWEDVPLATIARYWVKAHILPVSEKYNLKKDFYKEKVAMNREISGHLVKIIIVLSIQGISKVFRTLTYSMFCP